MTNTEAGEWLEYSVDIKQTGTYHISVSYAGTQAGIIRFELLRADLDRFNRT